MVSTFGSVDRFRIVFLNICHTFKLSELSILEVLYFDALGASQPAGNAQQGGWTAGGGAAQPAQPPQQPPADAQAGGVPGLSEADLGKKGIDPPGLTVCQWVVDRKD